MAKGTAKKSAKPAKKAGAKKAGAKKTSAKRTAAKPILLAGGNPQIPKSDGDAPVRAYLAAMPGWKRDVGRRLDTIIKRTVPTPPGVRKAVKWNTPFYGIDAQGAGDAAGWFLAFHCFANYIKVTFFRGTSLRPVPPVGSTVKNVRYLHIHENDPFDEAQFAGWVKQASLLPGERM